MNFVETAVLPLTLVFTACSTSNRHSDILFLETGRLLDGVHETVLEDMDLIIIDGRVAGAGKNLKVPANARIVDLKKFTVLPYEKGGTISLGLLAEIKAVEGEKVKAVVKDGQFRVSPD